jgi:hypothetical protein
MGFMVGFENELLGLDRYLRNLRVALVGLVVIVRVMIIVIVG